MVDFLETYSGFFLAESAGGTLAEIPESTLGTLFQQIFLVVQGRLEISARKSVPRVLSGISARVPPADSARKNPL